MESTADMLERMATLVVLRNTDTSILSSRKGIHETEREENFFWREWVSERLRVFS